MNHLSYAGIGTVLMGAVSLSVPASRVPQEHTSGKARDTLTTYRDDVLPLLQANCTPCHFPGGKVYKKLPFDDSATVAGLGKKLNTRLKKPEQQAIINGWVELEKKRLEQSM